MIPKISAPHHMSFDHNVVRICHHPITRVHATKRYKYCMICERRLNS
jgi:hypothetical protein